MKRCTYCHKIIWPWQLRVYGCLPDSIHVVYGLDQHITCHTKHMDEQFSKAYDRVQNNLQILPRG